MEKNTKQLIVFLTTLWEKIKNFTFKTEVINQIEIPEVNIPEVKFPEYPKEIKVNNIDELINETRKSSNNIIDSLSKDINSLISKEKNKNVVKALKKIEKRLNTKDLTPEVISGLDKLIKTVDKKTVDLSGLQSGIDSLYSLLDNVRRYNEINVRLNDKQIKEIGKNMSVSVSGGGGFPRGMATSAKQDDIISAINSSAVVYDTIEQTEVTLTNADTDYKLPSSEQTNRKLIIVMNNDDTEVVLGKTGSIDADSDPKEGIILDAGGIFTCALEKDLYAQCDSAGKKLTVIEMK